MDNNLALYNTTSFEISRAVTRQYSTSFYLASTFFDKEVRAAIFGIYGFVRLADEIVDTFHHTNKEALLNKFEADLSDALQQKISLNPVLHSFQHFVDIYNINSEHINAFLKSMRYDLTRQQYNNTNEINDYIYGSANVVGLMCLKVFCNGNNTLFEKLEKHAVKLGSAFQKVNFLRDLKTDTQTLNRNYFPNIQTEGFNELSKAAIVADIKNDFNEAYTGIVQLPKKSRFAVLIAYYYYLSLLNKIEKKPAQKILENRIRIPDYIKVILITRAYIVHKLLLP